MADNSTFDALAREIASFRATHDERPVAPRVTPGTIRTHLSERFDFSQGLALNSVIEEVSSMMRAWSLHTTHPRYFGLFNPNTPEAAIAADALAALYNPQLATWSHAPAANEIERHTLAFFLRLFGFDPETSAAHFTSGGAEANHTAVVVALTHRFPAYGNDGLQTIGARPVLYVSEQAHHSFHKAAHSTGLGRNAVRTVPVDRMLRMDCVELERQVVQDTADGFIPFMVVGTAGTTPAGVVDPLDDIARICRAHGLWFHADGAWGGAAIVSRSARAHLSGIAEADSITCDAHKWLSVSMSAGMFFCRHQHAVGDAFRITASYMPERVGNTVDNYATSMQWSRRFTGLKVFMALAEQGAEGFETMVDREIGLGRRLREGLEGAGWSVINHTPFPVVCFTHEALIDGRMTVNGVVQQCNDDGSAWISAVTLPHYGSVLRACIINHATRERDVDALVEALARIVQKMTAAENPSAAV